MGYVVTTRIREQPLDKIDKKCPRFRHDAEISRQRPAVAQSHMNEPGTIAAVLDEIAFLKTRVTALETTHAALIPVLKALRQFVESTIAVAENTG
jgi:hypothetical protein